MPNITRSRSESTRLKLLPACEKATLSVLSAGVAVFMFCNSIVISTRLHLRGNHKGRPIVPGQIAIGLRVASESFAGRIENHLPPGSVGNITEVAHRS